MKISEPGWNKKEENQRNNRLYGSLFLVLLPSQYLFYLLSFEFCLIKIMCTMVHDIFQGIVEHWQCFSAVWDSWKLTKQKSNTYKISWCKLHKTWKLYNCWSKENFGLFSKCVCFYCICYTYQEKWLFVSESNFTSIFTSNFSFKM